MVDHWENTIICVLMSVCVDCSISMSLAGVHRYSSLAVSMSMWSLSWYISAMVDAFLLSIVLNCIGSMKL